MAARRTEKTTTTARLMKNETSSATLASIAKYLFASAIFFERLHRGWSRGSRLQGRVRFRCRCGRGRHDPAVLASFACRRRFDGAKAVPYAVAQALGSFLASTLVYVTYRKALDSWVADHCAGVRDERTGGVWATFPQPFETTLDGFVDQLVGTALLLCGIFAVNDDRNFGASSPAKSASVAALVVAIGTAFGSD